MPKVGVNDVFTKLRQFVSLQHPRMTGFRMPYCNLYTDPVTKVQVFRAQVAYIVKPGDWLATAAIAQVDPEAGAVTMFKEGYTWSSWV